MRRRPSYVPFLVLSLLFHLGVGLLLATGVLAKLDWAKSSDVPDAPPTLTFMSEDSVKPPQHEFVPTIESQRAEKPPENTNLEAERNTALRSQEQGTQANSPLPQQTGNERASMAYENSPLLTPRQSQPSEAQPQIKPQEAKPEPKPETKPLTEEPKPKTELLPEDGLTLKPPKETEPKPKKTEESEQKSEKSPDQKARPEQPPPSPRSAYREKSAMTGGRTASIGPSSPAARDNEIARYKAKMYRAIGSLWYLKVDQNQSVLGIGSVKVKFYIRANGVIEKVSTSDMSGKVEVLDTISKQSVIGSGPFEPFTDYMKQQLGEGYWEDVTFSIY